MNDAIETNVVPLRWVGSVEDGHLEMLDQRRLPAEEVWHEMTTVNEVADGIREMVIRGAPAIGIAAAYGVALGFREFGGQPSEQDVAAMFELLATTRPTAVNLFWALERMRGLIEEHVDADPAGRLAALFDEARAIFDSDREHNLAMGRHGAALFEEPARILTHCNTGGLATGGYGTALGIIRALHAEERLEHVWVDETRPYLQGARLTTWECMKDGLPATLITDSMAAHFMKEGLVDAVIVGTDRVTANGDVANKIGTYGLAVLCKHHGIPFYVGAPVSTIDLETPSGDQIEIEQRSSREVTHVGETAIAPDGFPVAHPAFDVTPAEMVTAIITQWGVAEAPYERTLPPLVDQGAT
jgi:methylthioribose-1-phosphate isomerase